MTAILHYHLLLGSNQGNSLHNLYQSVQLLELYVGRVIRLSSIYRTAPWGEYDQADFLNQAVSIESSLSPREVLTTCQMIEKELGKNKVTQYGPRTIDIDILMAGEMVINESDLIVPHAKMCERNFVLIPLSQIEGDVIHPVENKSIIELKDACTDTGEVNILN